MKRHLSFILLAYSLIVSLIFAAPSPKLTAQGAILIEPSTNTILYKKNIHHKFYPASTTKVLSTLILAESLETFATERITKSKDSVDTVPSDSSHIGLAINDSYTYEDGLYAILLESDNFVSHDMARFHSDTISGFATLMNERAVSLGATNSHFVNPHGYHDSNHYTTPYDLALITKAAFENPVVLKIAGTPEYTFNLQNKSTLMKLEHTAPFFDSSSPFYNADIVAAKTGFHTPAGRTLVAKASYNGLDLIAVVMQSSYPDYFSDINQLFDYGYANFELASRSSERMILNNISYSDWAYPYIYTAISQGTFMPSTKSYMDPTTSREFINLIQKTVPLGYTTSLQPLLPKNSMSPYLINSNLTTKGAQQILATLSRHLKFILPDTFVEDTLNIHRKAPLEFITLEESIYLTRLFLHTYYTSSPHLTIMPAIYHAYVG